MSRTRRAAVAVSVAAGAGLLAGCGAGASPTATPATVPPVPPTEVTTPTTAAVHHPARRTLSVLISNRDPFASPSSGHRAAAKKVTTSAPTTGVPVTDAPVSSAPPGGSTVPPAPPAASTPPTTAVPEATISAEATTEIGRAMVDARRRGFATTHEWLSSAGSSESVEGEAGTLRGLQLIKVGGGGAYVLDSQGRAFVLGDAIGLRHLLRLSPSVASGAKRQWISIPRSSRFYPALTGGVTLPSILARTSVVGPFEVGAGHANLADGSTLPLVAIVGRPAPGSFLAKAGASSATLFLTIGADPLPFQVQADTPGGHSIVIRTQFAKRAPIPAPPSGALPLAPLVSGHVPVTTPPTFPTLHVHR